MMVGHCHTVSQWPQHQHERQSFVFFTSKSDLRVHWRQPGKGKCQSPKKIQFFIKTPLCRPYGASLHCPSSEARFLLEQILGNQPLAAETPHPVRLGYPTRKLNIFLKRKESGITPWHHCSSHARRKFFRRGRWHQGWRLPGQNQS